MALTPSTMLQLGTEAIPFELPDSRGKIYTLDSFGDAKALLMAFICNHCPYVVHIRDAFAGFSKEYQNSDLAIVAINANDVANYAADSPERMAKEIESVGYVFPYLFDESQEVAKAYRAACTPEFYLFDRDRKLVYRGQFDDSRPGNDQPITGKDLRDAVEAVLSGEKVSSDQKPSIGCNIKWKPGNEPDYFG